jgi:hypothetical protein
MTDLQSENMHRMMAIINGKTNLTISIISMDAISVIFKIKRFSKEIIRDCYINQIDGFLLGINSACTFID